MTTRPGTTIPAHVRSTQDRIWSQKSYAEKVALVGRLWLQARALKRATLRSLHPEWEETELDGAVREAMGGRRL
jgi:hypothetical protein